MLLRLLCAAFSILPLGAAAFHTMRRCSFVYATLSTPLSRAHSLPAVPHFNVAAPRYGIWRGEESGATAVTNDASSTGCLISERRGGRDSAVRARGRYDGVGLACSCRRLSALSIAVLAPFGLCGGGIRRVGDGTSPPALGSQQTCCGRTRRDGVFRCAALAYSCGHPRGRRQ